MQRFLFLCLIVFIFSCRSGKAQTYIGCYYPGDNRIYISVDLLGFWYNPLSLNCNAGNATYARNLTKRTGTYKCSASGRSLAGGDEYLFNIVNCPLDNNLFLFVVSSAFFGWFFIKKYKNCMMI